MKLFICEKPSQARDIAKHLGARQQGTGCLVGNGVTVTWCIGHLLEQAAPEHYQPELKTWDLALLPVVPQQWKMNVKSSVKDQFKAVSQLVKQAKEIVIATDADREGEVIAREVLQLCGYRGLVSRLWLSALDDASVKKALAKLLPGSKTLPMYLSGMGRARADWLAGMNITMALTKAFGRGGKGSVLHCGRVQTPVLGLIVRREKIIRNFKPKTFYVLDAIFEMMGTLVPMNYVLKEGMADKDGHIVQPEILQAIATKVKGKVGRVQDVQSTPEKELAPLLYSLGSLQRDASKIYGLKAQMVLDACQALYEKHKATTYPRTDCEYLPESMFVDVKDVLSAMVHSNKGIQALVASIQLGQPPRVFNDKKITAHHAIIPTANLSVRTSDMSVTELKIYNLICARFLAQFLGAYEYTKTVIKVICTEENFIQTGKTPRVMGWKRINEVYGIGGAEKEARASKKGNQEAEGEETESANVLLPAVKAGDQAINRKAEVTAKQTKPLKRYTEGTLLGAMESIDKEIEDPRLKRIMQNKEKAGIGTDATRSSIIEGLFKREYITAEKKNLVPTDRGIQLIELIEKIDPSLADPVLTALWEDQLGLIENGSNTLEKFEADLASWLHALLEKIKKQAGSIQVQSQMAGTAVQGSKKPVKSQFACEACGSGLVLRNSAKGAFWGCSGYPNCKVILADENGKPGAKKQSPSMAEPVGQVVFLKVPFEDKDKVKALGAKWSAERKSWYVPQGVQVGGFKGWFD